MEIQAGVGMSHHRNPKVAGQEAAQKALETAGIDKPDFVFMIADRLRNGEEIIADSFEKRGTIQIKGKGDMETYLLIASKNPG